MSICNFPILFGVCVYVFSMFVCSCEQVHVCMPMPLQLHSLFYLRETDVLTVSSLRHLSLYPSSSVVHLSLRSGGLDREDF